MIVNKAWFIIVTFYLTILIVVQCGIISPREMDIRRTQQMDPKKRPFCNAFTGCGKKRSELSAPNVHDNGQTGQEEAEEENSLSDLIDLNSEPAVEDLMRQIMSQAKLWEAIQEASREIYSQKHNLEHSVPRYPISFNSQ